MTFHNGGHSLEPVLRNCNIEDGAIHLNNIKIYIYILHYAADVSEWCVCVCVYKVQLPKCKYG